MYRSLILSVLLICIYPSQSSIESDVQALIQKIQDALPETINIPEANIIVPDNQFISGFFNLSNFNITGLKAFDLKVKFLFGLVPQGFSFNLDKLELDTDYLFRMPLFNLDFLKLYGMGKVHLLLSDLSMNASLQVNFTAPLKDLKLSLGATQFGITGFMDDPHISEELSEDLTRGISSTVNNENFATLVETVLNDIVASFSKNKTVTWDSSEEMNDNMSAEESLYIILNTFQIWIEDAFRDYTSTTELDNNFPWQ